MPDSNNHNPIRLFSGPLDLDSHRVRFALSVKQINFNLSEVFKNELNDDLQDLTSLNEIPSPYTVPTMIDRDTTIYNGLVILEYLEERYPSPLLMPAFPGPRASARILMREIETEWSSRIEVKHSKQRGEVVSLTGTTKAQREENAEAIKMYATRLSSLYLQDSVFLIGNDITYVDCCVAPVLWRLDALGISLQKIQHRDLRNYMDRIFELDEFKASLSDDEQELRD